MGLLYIYRFYLHIRRLAMDDENEKTEDKEIPQYVTERIFGVERREPRYS